MVHMFCGLRSHAENRYPSKKNCPQKPHLGSAGCWGQFDRIVFLCGVEGGLPLFSGRPLGFAAPMFLTKCRQSSPTQLRDRAYPLARIHVYLHQDKPNGFVDVAACENQQERRLPHKTGQADAGQDHRVHERDFQDRAVSSVTR